MPLFTKESLELLRSRIDLAEVLSAHVDLKRHGGSYKALCPFHEERTPSFTLQKGDNHYHCFGCGAHGDAIGFLMEYLKMSFLEAVENLADRFHVSLERVEKEERKGPSKAQLKEALDKACHFYHFSLLHTQEGQEALHYLYERGLDLDFIRHFQLGFAPKTSGLLRKALAGFSDEVLKESGLLGREGREFFYERITFPIREASGAVIGFSARKIKETTFGGKYINTPETYLFKKSQILFGLNYSRRRIAKEKRALIVEGQIDALRLIQEGFNLTVASLGTAFGEGHVKTLLHLGVTQVYLAFDADLAGEQAVVKVGDLFQKEGVEVFVVSLPPGEDPDTVLCRQGAEGFIQGLQRKTDYLTFLVAHAMRHYDGDSPAGKTQMTKALTERVRQWNNPVMVHESLRKLSRLLLVPEEMIGLEPEARNVQFFKKSAFAGPSDIDPHRILETDLLRWLLLMGKENPLLIEIVKLNLTPAHFLVESCQRIYTAYLKACAEDAPLDLLSLAIHLDDEKAQLLISEILQKRVKKERAINDLVATVQKLLDRQWMQEGEEIKRKIQSGQLSDDEAMGLAKKLAQLKKALPQVRFPEESCSSDTAHKECQKE